MKKKIPLFSLLLCLLVLFPLSAFAETPGLPEETKMEVRQILTERFVPKEKQDLLLEKLERGELWDSMKKEYADLKAQIQKNGYEMTIYPDGSYLIRGTLPDITNMEEVLVSGLSTRNKIKAMLSGKLFTMGVNPETRESLIAKWERGEQWDSMKGEYANLKPQYDKNGRTRTVYPDGSVKVTEVRSDITAPSAPCPWQKAMEAGIKPGAAYMDNGIVAMYFETLYRQSEKTGEAQILRCDNHSIRVLTGTGDREEKGFLDLWRNPTHAWYAVPYAPSKGGPSERFWVKFYADGKKTW